MSGAKVGKQRGTRSRAITRAMLLALAGVAALAAALAVSMAAPPAPALAATYDQEIDLSTCTSNVVISAAGTYRLYGATTQYGVKVNTSDAVYITLDNATIGSDTMAQPAVSCGADTTLYLMGASTLDCGAGTLARVDSWACIYVTTGDNLTIDLAPGQAYGGGMLTVYNHRKGGGPTIGGYSCGYLTINGGTVNAYGGPSGPGIGCYGFTDSTGTVTINGGNVTAYGPPATSEAPGAGIGTGGNAAGPQGCGVVTINGGNVTAVGADRSAGIGGGNGSDGFDPVPNDYSLIVTGGSVFAQGSTGSAGIGGSQWNNCGGSILISGGTVTANGGQYGAGIGGGEEQALGGGGEGGEFHITGGTVIATGGENGAGIGGGSGGQAETTYLMGGVVVATGGDKAAGIGGGYTGDTTKNDEQITITGGAGTAVGTNGGAGIGGGRENWAGTGGQGGPVVIIGGSIKAIGGGSGAQGIGHGYSDSHSGSLTNGWGDTVTLTQVAGIFAATSPTAVGLRQHITTSHTAYDYLYSGTGHGGGDTSVYVYLPVGVAFQPVTAFLGPLTAEPAAVTLSPRLRTWLVTRLEAAKWTYDRKLFFVTIAILKDVRHKVMLESGRGIPKATATRWVYILDLLVKHVAAEQSAFRPHRPV